MRILFIHQNCPAQFKYLAPRLAADRDNEVWFITREGKPNLAGVKKAEYKLARQPTEKIHPYVKPYEEQVLYGQGAARAAVSIKGKGFVPDVIYCHPGWGEGLFIKDVFPDSKLLNYTEFYYNAFGADVHFEPGAKFDLDRVCRIRAKNANNLLSLVACDWAVSPTRWQWQQNPPELRSKISVIHDGINAEVCAPVDQAELKLPDGRVLRKGDEIITYVSRNLEPYRGFPVYMKVVERLCKSRPNAHFVIVGGDGVSYGAALPDKKTYREELLKQVKIDPERVHFLGQVPYPTFLKVLQVSSCHVYLTYPFVLSWSFLEAMSTGCVIVGSRTPPVQEVVVDRENGLLVDFFDDAAIAAQVEEVLEHPDGMAHIRRAARQTVLDSYQLKHCMARHIGLLRDLAHGRMPPGEKPPAG
ncbi:glycosyl transferase family 1 [Allostella vacuolata]|nr:glycosyl transferase family 1 [Stella vacuolata]